MKDVVRGEKKYDFINLTSTKIASGTRVFLHGNHKLLPSLFYVRSKAISCTVSSWKSEGKNSCIVCGVSFFSRGRMFALISIATMIVVSLRLLKIQQRCRYGCKSYRCHSIYLELQAFSPFSYNWNASILCTCKVKCIQVHLSELLSCLILILEIFNILNLKVSTQYIRNHICIW